MAKTSLTTGTDGQGVHARTTGGSEKSQTLVLGIDGSDSVVPADATNGVKVDVAALKAEDAAHASGDQGLMLLAVRQDTAAALAGTNGDYLPLITDSTGRLHTAPLASGTNAIGTVEATKVTPGVNPTDLGKAEDAAHVSGDTGVAIWAVRKDTATALAGTDGDYAPLEVDASGRLWVNVGAIPAAARTTDSIASAPQTGVIMQGLTERTPVFAAVDVATSGDNTLVSAQGASNKIRVHQVTLVAAAAVTVRFESGAGGTALTGQMQLAANSGFVMSFSPMGWFETAANTLLNLELSGAVSVDGVIGYSVVT